MPEVLFWKTYEYIIMLIIHQCTKLSIQCTFCVGILNLFITAIVKYKHICYNFYIRIATKEKPTKLNQFPLETIQYILPQTQHLPQECFELNWRNFRRKSVIQSSKVLGINWGYTHEKSLKLKYSASPTVGLH